MKTLKWYGESWGTWGACTVTLDGLPDGLKHALAALPTHKYQGHSLVNDREMEDVISKFGGKLVHWLASGRHMIVPVRTQASNINGMLGDHMLEDSEIQAAAWETVT